MLDVTVFSLYKNKKISEKTYTQSMLLGLIEKHPEIKNLKNKIFN